jgi:hypothetical protein
MSQEPTASHHDRVSHSKKSRDSKALPDIIIPLITLFVTPALSFWAVRLEFEHQKSFQSEQHKIQRHELKIDEMLKMYSKFLHLANSYQANRWTLYRSESFVNVASRFLPETQGVINTYIETRAKFTDLVSSQINELRSISGSLQFYFGADVAKASRDFQESLNKTIVPLDEVVSLIETNQKKGKSFSQILSLVSDLCMRNASKADFDDFPVKTEKLMEVMHSALKVEVSDW